jgi:hypothetical protein
MKAEEFDRRFDNGEDITEYLDLTTLSRPGKTDMLLNLDPQVQERLGISTEEIIHFCQQQSFDHNILKSPGETLPECATFWLTNMIG